MDFEDLSFFLQDDLFQSIESELSEQLHVVCLLEMVITSCQALANWLGEWEYSNSTHRRFEEPVEGFKAGM